MKNSQKPFYKTWWGIILTFLFFPFVIPFIIWKYTNWSKWVKIFCIFLFFIIFFSYTANEWWKIQEARRNFCNQQLALTGATNISLTGSLEIIWTFEKDKNIFEFSCTGTSNNFIFSTEQKPIEWEKIIKETEIIWETKQELWKTENPETTIIPSIENTQKTEEIPQENNKIKAKVIQITDGDTIKVQSEWIIHTLRIVWFDAPEITTTRYWYIECYGQEAVNYLKNYLPINAEVEIIYHWGDKYNRDLAEIFYKNISIAEIMIKNGHGWVYRDGIQPSNYEELLRFENIAKNNKIGIWSHATCNGKRKAIIEPTKTEIKPTTQNNITPKNTTTSSWNPEPFQKEFHNPGCHIKWNINSKWEKIYHMPTGKFYSKTNPEACFNTEQEARNAGFRPSKQ